jgi:WD40 repeat protein
MMKRVEHEDERRFDELKQLMLIAKLKEELSKNPQNFPKPLPFSPSQETSTASPDKDCTPQSYSPPISSQSLLENKKPEFKYQEIEHQDKVLGAEFSPDGSQILTYGGQTAQIWDSNTCKLIGQPIHHDQDIQSARFSPDGAQILIYSGQTAQVWDKATFKRIGSPLSHDGKIRSAEFSPDGARIVTTSEDGTAKVWDAKTAQALGMPMHHADSAWESPKVIKACFSLDGSHIFTISSDFSDWSLWKWESATDKALAEPLRHGRKVWHAEFSPDGSRILTCSDEIVQLWDAETLHAFSEPMPMLHQTGVRTVQFSPDGNCIVTGADDTAQLWDVKTGQAKGGSLRHAGEVEHARFSLDGTRVAIQTREGQVQVWHVQTGARLAHIFAPDGKSLYGTPVFSPNGHYILTRSFFIVRLWDAETGQIIGEPMDHQNRVYSAEFNADGSRIITHTHDTAQVWDAMTGKRVGPSATSPGNGVRFNAKRTQFIGFFDNVVGINDATKDDLPQILAEMQPMMHRERVASAQFSLDGSRIITTCEDDTAQVWDATNGDPLGGPIRLKHRIESINSNPDGSRLLTTSRDGAAMLWRLPALTKFRQQVPDWIPAFACAACGLRFDPDGEIKAIPAKERLKVLRQPRPDLDAWAKLARWIATPNSERTLTPESHFTCRQIAESERDAVPPNRQALESAIRYDPSVPLAHLLLAEFLEAKENMPNITDIGRARHLREYGLKLLADNNDELCLRAAESLFRQKDYAKCRAAAKKVGLSASDTLRQAAMQIQTKSELMMMRPRLLWASRDANSGEV